MCVCVCVCVRVCVCVCVCVSVCVCVRVCGGRGEGVIQAIPVRKCPRAHTHTHTHTHIPAPTPPAPAEAVWAARQLPPSRIVDLMAGNHRPLSPDITAVIDLSGLTLIGWLLRVQPSSHRSLPPSHQPPLCVCVCVCVCSCVCVCVCERERESGVCMCVFVMGCVCEGVLALACWAGRMKGWPIEDLSASRFVLGTELDLWLKTSDPDLWLTDEL